MEEQAFFYRDTWAEVNLDCISDNINLNQKAAATRS